MIFQSKMDRALKKLHDESDTGEAERSREYGAEGNPQLEMPELEKNDFLAMVIAALITIIPAAFIVLVGVVLIGYFLLMH